MSTGNARRSRDVNDLSTEQPYTYCSIHGTGLLQHMHEFEDAGYTTVGHRLTQEGETQPPGQLGSQRSA